MASPPVSAGLEAKDRTSYRVTAKNLRLIVYISHVI